MDIKKYKKEQEAKTPYQKISTALTAARHVAKKTHDTSQKLKGIRGEMVHKISTEERKKRAIKNLYKMSDKSEEEKSRLMHRAFDKK